MSNKMKRAIIGESISSYSLLHLEGEEQILMIEREIWMLFSQEFTFYFHYGTPNLKV